MTFDISNCYSFEMSCRNVTLQILNEKKSLTFAGRLSISPMTPSRKPWLMSINIPHPQSQYNTKIYIPSCYSHVGVNLCKISNKTLESVIGFMQNVREVSHFYLRCKVKKLPSLSHWGIFRFTTILRSKIMNIIYSIDYNSNSFLDNKKTANR